MWSTVFTFAKKAMHASAVGTGRMTHIDITLHEACIEVNGTSTTVSSTRETATSPSSAS